ncbi:MAG: hypothetical protein WD877_00980 [Candidatus Saccharimonadales bacterium]
MTSVEVGRNSESIWPVQGVDFFEERGALLVNVGGHELIDSLIEKPEVEELLAHGFNRKEELHITVLGYENGKRIIDATKHYPDSERQALLYQFGSMANSLRWSWQPTGEIHVLHRRERGGLKVFSMVECSDAEFFYQYVEITLPGTYLRRQPLHVTLLKKAFEKNRTNARVGGLAIGRPLISLSHLLHAPTEG